MDNEPLFIKELFKDECDHGGEKICVDNLKFRVFFEKRKLDLSIFIFDEPINDQSSENKIQELLINQRIPNRFIQIYEFVLK